MMNIIQAIQKAEQGHFIRDHVMIPRNIFIKYEGNGLFVDCTVRQGKIIRLNGRNSFSMAEILSTSWETISFFNHTQ